MGTNTLSRKWDAQRDVASVIMDVDKRSAHLNRVMIKFAILGYGKGKKNYSQKNKNLRSLPHAALKLECTLLSWFGNCQDYKFT